MELREVPDPVAGPGEVVVRVRACGVDRGGDLYVWRSTPGMPFAVPVIPGAENCGEIAEVGEGVRGWEVGDRVVSEVIVGSCGACAYCHGGHPMHCRERVDLGRAVDGAYAEYFAVPAAHVHRIPDGVTFRAAVLAEMAAVAARNLCEQTVIRPGDDVAIVGPGPVGLLSVQLAVAAGARHVVMVGLKGDRSRLELARALGATDAITSDTEGFADAYPDGFDVVADTSGTAGGVQLAIDLAKPLAQVAAIGTPVGKQVPLEWVQVALKGLTIRGTYAHAWSTWELVLDLMGRGALTPEPLVTHVLPLERWEDAFNQSDGDREAIKIAVTPGGEL
jgi:2-desacetyl-2-hydroxyethyl bacteriochlorophyllide A dehydrogenase